MAQTFDTSRVGGGTYELEQDASGNYKLKSVGFAQVNKLNLPDLATSDSPVKKILLPTPKIIILNMKMKSRLNQKNM